MIWRVRFFQTFFTSGMIQVGEILNLKCHPIMNSILRCISAKNTLICITCIMHLYNKILYYLNISNETWIKYEIHANRRDSFYIIIIGTEFAFTSDAIQLFMNTNTHKRVDNIIKSFSTAIRTTRLNISYSLFSRLIIVKTYVQILMGVLVQK